MTLALEITAAVLLLATYAYSARKGFEAGIERRRARVLEGNRAAVDQMRMAIENVQAQVHGGRITKHAEILEAAADIVARAGLRGVFTVEVSPGGAKGWRIDLRPREPGAALRAWLLAHEAVAILALPAVLLHARFAMGGPLTAALLVLFAASVATGVVAGALRHLGSAGAEIDLLMRQLAALETELAAAMPGSGRAQVFAVQRQRLLTAKAGALGRLKLVDICLLVHVPLAAAVLALFILHVAQAVYF